MVRTGKNHFSKIHLNIYIGAFIMFFIMSMVVSGCSKSKSNTRPVTQPTSNELETDSFRYAMKNEHGNCEVFIDFPKQDGTAIAQAVTEYIKSSLFENSSSQVGNDPDVIIRTYCEQTLNRLGKTLEQMGIRHVDEADAPEEGTEMRLIYQSDKVVTYEIYRYSYLTNGPHGEYSQYGVSFRRSDGKRLGSDIIKKTDATFYAMLREGLRQYFDITSDEELQDICTIDITEPPLPTFPPCLMGDGVRFHYSIYDVCEFDDGDPAFTIPYSRIMPYLSQEAQELIER